METTDTVENNFTFPVMKYSILLFSNDIYVITFYFIENLTDVVVLLSFSLLFKLSKNITFTVPLIACTKKYIIYNIM